MTTRPDRANRVDGRWIVSVVVTLYLGVVIGLRQALAFDLWPYLGVNSAPSIFYDLRNVLAAIECRRRGLNPLEENPCDPSDRVLAYPRIWLLLRHAGLDQSHTAILGWCFVCLLMVSLLLLLGQLTVPQGAVVAAAVCSPAVMLSVERGNVDVLLFALLVGAAFAWPTSHVWPLGPGLVVLAAVAKLYGAFALPAFLLSRFAPVRALVVLASAAGFVVSLSFTSKDLAAVTRSPEGGLLYSYGARILPGHLYHALVPGEWEGGALLAQVIAVIPVLLLMAAAAAWAWRHMAPEAGDGMLASPSLVAFHMGALVYLGTFLARKNGDYRLVLLLLLLPQLLVWAAGSAGDTHRRVARHALGALTVALYAGALSPYIGPWDELASWWLALVLAAILTAALPFGRGRTRTGTAAAAAQAD